MERGKGSHWGRREGGRKGREERERDRDRPTERVLCDEAANPCEEAGPSTPKNRPDFPLFSPRLEKLDLDITGA